MHRSLCICSLLPSLQTRTRLVLVLHQLEARKTTNTGQLAVRCLTNSCVVLRGRDRAAYERLPELPPLTASGLWAEGTQPLLLFPHETATPITEWVGGAAPITLIVPDGTWRQAVKTRKRLAGLDQVPCVTVPETAAGSRYRLRQTARPQRLATIEAIARALGVLEGPAVEAALERVFAVMVDRTLWTNGRLERALVTGGIPPGAQSHDPLGGAASETPPGPGTRSTCP